MDRPDTPHALVVIADVAQARILHFFRDEKRLVECSTLINKEGTTPERDLTTDTAGRAFDRVGAGRHAIHDADARLHGAQAFAKQVAKEMDRQCETGRVSRIIIAAAPKFLGLLRKALSRHCQRLVVATINKELRHLSEDDILVQLADELTRRVVL